MSEEVLELWKFIIVAVVPALATLIALAISTSHARRGAEAERGHQELMAKGAAADAAIEHRFADRQEAFLQLVRAVEFRRDEDLSREWQGDSSPMDLGYEQGDFFSHSAPMREALTKVSFLGTRSTREAAKSMVDALTQYSFTWRADDFRQLEERIIQFREAALVDLGIEPGPQTEPDTKPKLPPPEARPSRFQNPDM
ncbi:MAG: hypothetical protein ACTHU1_11705 [Arachnia sp.]